MTKTKLLLIAALAGNTALSGSRAGDFPADAPDAVGGLLSAYERWTIAKGLTPGVNDAPTDNPDAAGGSRLDNLAEFGLGGDPLDAADEGLAPIAYMAGTNMVYVYPRLSDPDSGLDYYLETKENLLSQPWTNSDCTVAGEGVFNAAFNAVTNFIPADFDTKFVRLALSPYKRAEIRPVNGTPRLYIDGRRTVPMAYKSLGSVNRADYWADSQETIALVRDAGLHLYEIRVQLHTLGLPTRLFRGSAIPWNMHDDDIDDIIAIDPDARFIIDLGLTPEASYRSHNQMSFSNPYPSQTDYSGMVWDYKISTGEIVPHDRQSPLSEKIWQDVEMSVGHVIDHLEARYGDRIIMYWPAFSDIGEWYYGIWNGDLVPGFGPSTVAGFQTWASNKYSTVGALNAAWGTSLSGFSGIAVPSWPDRTQSASGSDFFDPDEDRYEVDFFDFFNGTMNYGAKRIAAYIKGATDSEKLVGMFWQYLHPLAKTSLDKGGLNHSGHLKLMELLGCSDIDVLGTPIYPEVEHWTMPFHGTVDTIQQHGKLFWHEDDLRTHLSDYPEKSSGIAETLKVYAYDFQEWIERQCGFWFFDFASSENHSILNDPDMWNYVKERKAYWETFCLSESGAEFSPEIAVIRNEKSALYMVTRNDVLPAVYSADKNDSLTQMIQHIVGVRDAPVGWYMLEDFIDGNIPSSVKMYVFADAFVVDESDAQAVLARLDEQPGCMAVWFYAPGYVDPAHSGPDAIDVGFIERLTGGIRPALFSAPILDRISPEPHALTEGVPNFGTHNTGFNPQFYIEPGQAGVETLGKYTTGGGRIAAAILPRGGGRDWDSVYICSPAIAPELLGNLVDRLDMDKVDGFNDTTLAQWTVSAGKWAVEQGELRQTAPTGNARITLTGYTASNLVMEADVRLSGTEWAGLQFRKTNETDSHSDSGYLVYLRSTGVATLYKPGGQIISAASGYDPTRGFLRLRVEAVGSSIKVYLNDELLIDEVDSTYTDGYCGLATWANGSAVFDRISISRKE